MPDGCNNSVRSLSVLVTRGPKFLKGRKLLLTSGLVYRLDLYRDRGTVACLNRVTKTFN